MKIITYIVGSQARWLVKTFPTDIRKIPYITWVKVRAWLLRPFIQEYWVDNAYLLQFVLSFKPTAKTRVISVPMDIRVYPKEPHPYFTILYYYPKREYNRKYCRWVYGKDIIEALANHYYPEFMWVGVDGTKDMSRIMPFVDVYLRPNRHDGTPRLVEECWANGIPYYWSNSEPDMEAIFQFIQFHYEQFKAKK